MSPPLPEFLEVEPGCSLSMAYDGAPIRDPIPVHLSPSTASRPEKQHPIPKSKPSRVQKPISSLKDGNKVFRSSWSGYTTTRKEALDLVSLFPSWAATFTLFGISPEAWAPEETPKPSLSEKEDVKDIMDPKFWEVMERKEIAVGQEMDHLPPQTGAVSTITMPVVLRSPKLRTPSPPTSEGTTVSRSHTRQKALILPHYLTGRERIAKSWGYNEESEDEDSDDDTWRRTKSTFVSFPNINAPVLYNLPKWNAVNN